MWDSVWNMAVVVINAFFGIVGILLVVFCLWSLCLMAKSWFIKE